MAPFSRNRMTWIKPSFGWMMYRSGWGAKPGQERVLAVEISRSGFEWALAHSFLSHYQPGQHESPEAWASLRDASPVRIQWDPDRSLAGERLSCRAIQIGLSGQAVQRYCDEWIRSVTDVTAAARQAELMVRAGRVTDAARMLPVERPYPLSPELSRRIGAGPEHKERYDDGGGSE